MFHVELGGGNGVFLGIRLKGGQFVEHHGSLGLLIGFPEEVGQGQPMGRFFRLKVHILTQGGFSVVLAIGLQVKAGQEQAQGHGIGVAIDPLLEQGFGPGNIIVGGIARGQQNKQIGPRFPLLVQRIQEGFGLVVFLFRQEDRRLDQTTAAMGGVFAQNDIHGFPGPVHLTGGHENAGHFTLRIQVVGVQRHGPVEIAEGTLKILFLSGRSAPTCNRRRQTWGRAESHF